MKLLNPPMFIFIVGFFGFIFSLSSNQGASRLPIALFFLFVMIVGITLIMYPKKLSEEFGEFSSDKGDVA